MIIAIIYIHRHRYIAIMHITIYIDIAISGIPTLYTFISKIIDVSISLDLATLASHRRDTAAIFSGISTYSATSSCEPQGMTEPWESHGEIHGKSVVNGGNLWNIYGT